MNIDKLIYPRFKRFETMNLGLKRLLFLVTFPICVLALFMAIANVIILLTSDQDFDSDSGMIILTSISIILCYIPFWVSVRILYWVFDGFFQGKN